MRFWTRVFNEAILAAVVISGTAGLIFMVGGNYLGASLSLPFVCGTAFVAGLFGVALALSDVIRRRRTELTEELFQQGIDAYEKQDYDLSIRIYTEILRIRPRFADAYVNRGVARKMKGEFDSAILDHNEAIRLRPDLAMAFYSRANAHAGKEEYDLALIDYSTAIQLDPNDPSFRHNRGVCHGCLKEYELAIADFSEGLSLAPENPEMFFLRGLAHYQMGEFIEAKEDLINTIRLDAKHASGLCTLAWIHATCPLDTLRNGTTAVEQATNACALTDWSNANYLDTLAAAHAESGDFQAAVEWEKKAIELCQDQERIDRYSKRLHLYEQEKPYRDERPSA